MATPVIMPRQGQSVESCIIGQWHKKVGDLVSVGEDLFTYETDKAAFDESAKVDGELLAIFFAEGDDVPCLTTVCVIGTKGEDVSRYDPASDSKAPPVPASAPAAVDQNASSVQAETLVAGQPQDRATLADLSISPRARSLARKQGADLRAVVPTGPKGRVIERDIQALINARKFATGASGTGYSPEIVGSGIGGRVSVADLAKAAAEPAPAVATRPSAQPAAYEEKHSHIRKLIAKSMVQSLSAMAQVTYNASFDASAILEFRARLKKAKESGLAEQLGIGLAMANITLNDIILYTVSRVVKNHRLCNAHYHDDKMVFFNHVNLGMAVDTPRGLMVPTLFNADRLTITELSAQAKALSADCQKGTISPDLLKDGTLTVTNLGSFGIESFTPVINPPQTAILGVNGLTTAVRNVNGQAVPYPSMGLSLTCDHRAIDGAPAARFLKDLRMALENFTLLLTN
jgi:pyruvate dehydrogenase E2 component (dihydrolipoamide acetyltransferase)